MYLWVNIVHLKEKINIHFIKSSFLDFGKDPVRNCLILACFMRENTFVQELVKTFSLQSNLKSLRATYTVYRITY